MSPFDQTLNFINEKLFDSSQDWAELLLIDFLKEISK